MIVENKPAEDTIESSRLLHFPSKDGPMAFDLSKQDRVVPVVHRLPDDVSDRLHAVYVAAVIDGQRGKRDCPYEETEDEYIVWIVGNRHGQEEREF